ncbi:MAG: hypothetical protein WEB60_08310 [Terrimicrobiaceae bacterium]
MNNHIEHPADNIVQGITTPFYLDPAIHPRSYLTASLSPWVGLPIEEARAAMSDAQKTKLTKLITQTDAQAAIVADNDPVGRRKQAAQHIASGTDCDFARAEVLSREAAACDLSALAAAREKVKALDADLLSLAKDILSTTADAVLSDFVTEAQAAEARLTKYGRPLSATGLQEGFEVTNWELHTDAILGGMFTLVHALKFHFPAEVDNAKYFESWHFFAWLRELNA